MTEVRSTAPTLLDLPLSSIRPSATNPRRHFDAEAMNDLKRSIAQSGIQVPLLVRSMVVDREPGYYELVAGARRFKAAEEMGFRVVPCIVREMSDAEAREAQIVENLQRADVHPLEEAEAFQELLETLGSIPAVAAKLGKEQSYVAKCLRLMALTLPSRDALRGRLIAIEHAMLLARLAEAEQNAALKWTLDRNAGSKTTVDKVVADCLERMRVIESGEKRNMHYRWEPETVVRLKAWIEAESGILLSHAPWSLTDEDYLLPDVGPCSECPKNTKANAPLFGDLEMGEATCTDGACFAAKTAGFVQIEMRKAGYDDAAKPKVLVPRLSWKYSGAKPSLVPNDIDFSIKNTGQTANPAKLLKAGHWVEAKAGSCTNVRPGITADWSDAGERGYTGDGKKLRKPGELLQVCIAVGCKAHPKDWEKPKSGSGSNDDQQKRQREEAEKRKAYLVVEIPVRKAVYAAIKAKAKVDATEMLRTLLRKAVHEFESPAICELAGIAFLGDGDDWKGRGAACKAVNAEIGKREGHELMSLAFDVLSRDAVTVGSQPQKQDREDLWALAKRYKVDADAIAAKLSPEPAKKVVAKKVAAKKTATADSSAALRNDKQKKTTAKKAAKRTLTLEARKRIVDAMKKRWADRRKGAKA